MTALLLSRWTSEILGRPLAVDSDTLESLSERDPEAYGMLEILLEAGRRTTGPDRRVR